MKIKRYKHNINKTEEVKNISDTWKHLIVNFFTFNDYLLSGNKLYIIRFSKKRLLAFICCYRSDDAFT